MKVIRGWKTVGIFLSFLIASAVFLFLPKVVFGQVVINEFLPNSASGQNEWVELYNLGSEPINLAGWILADDASHNKTLDHLGQILPTGFVMYEYSGGDGWLNNGSGDILFLKNGDVEINSYSYDSDPGEGITFGRSPDGIGEWFVLNSATPNTSNSLPVPTPTLILILTPTPRPTNTPTPELTSTPTPTPKPTPTPTKKPTPTLTPTPIPTDGEVLGEEIGTSSSVLTDQGENPVTEENTETGADFNSLLPKILIGLGLLLILVSLGTLLFPKIRKYNGKNESKITELS